LAGKDTRRELETSFTSQRAHPWPRPDALGCLVEAAVTAEGYDRPDRAAVLTATVTGMRGDFLLPEICLADLSALTERYATEVPRSELPERLFGS
jgi:hypothetical protein